MLLLQALISFALLLLLLVGQTGRIHGGRRTSSE
jgi:hypothetical protein